MEQRDAIYWNNRFANNETSWDIGHVSDPLKSYFDQISDKHSAILIPGCGNSYEATYLLENGFTNVTVIDIAIIPTQKIKEKLGNYLNKQLTVINDDFFELKGQFDLIIEQTFFCAIDPLFRKKYIIQADRLLKPGGKVAGLLFNCQFEKEGPPFGGDTNEYRELFEPAFNIITMEPCFNSIKPRQGREVFFIAQKPA